MRQQDSLAGSVDGQICNKIMIRKYCMIACGGCTQSKLSMGRWSSRNSFRPPEGKLVDSISMEGKLVIFAEMGGMLVNCR